MSAPVRASARAKSPARGAGGPGVIVIDDDKRDPVDVALPVAFGAILIGFAAMFFEVVIVLVLLIGIAGLYTWAVTQPDRSPAVGWFCVILMFGMAAPAFFLRDVVNYGHCNVDKNTTMWKATERFTVECLECTAWALQVFGPDSEFLVKKTASGGAEEKWPECFNRDYKSWDLCKIQEYVERQLTCRK